MTTNTEPLKVGELKPCPICGDDGEKGFQDVTVMNGDRDKYRRVICRVCGCMVPEHNWNTRTEPSPADVTRYGCTTGGMEEQEDGDYVLYCDYRQATQQSPARVEGELTDGQQYIVTCEKFDKEGLTQYFNEFVAMKGKPEIGFISEGWVSVIAEELPSQIERALNQRLAVKEGAPLTETYIQTVPDKCDRIVWRNSYYHLPLKDDQQAKDAARGYCEAMLEAETLAAYLIRQPLRPDESGAMREVAIRDVEDRIRRYKDILSTTKQEG